MVDSIGRGEIPGELTFDIWKDYAQRGKAEELDASLAEKFKDLYPDILSGSFSDPVEYANQVQQFYTHQYKDGLGINPLQDAYVVRRLSFNLASAKSYYESGNANVANLSMFEEGMTSAFHILSENYANADRGRAEYYRNYDDPNVFISLFGPIMDALPMKQVYLVVNTVGNKDQSKQIMKRYREVRVKGGADGQTR